MRHYTKHFIAYSICILLTFTTSCQNGHTGSKELNLAESLMDIKPDSALTVLKQIKNTNDFSKKQQAIYHLLLTYAQDKNYMTPASDSIINLAVNYFDRHSDPYWSTLAYYCKGRVSAETGDAMQAHEYYLKALELGESSKNHILLIKIYNNLGRFYAYLNMNEMALPMYKKALNLLLLENESANTSYALRNISRIFTQINEVDSAILYYKKALLYTKDQNKPTLFNDLACLYLNQKQYQEASAHLSKALNPATKTPSMPAIYLSQGRLLKETAQLDSAEFYLKESMQTNNQYTQIAALFYLSEIEKEKQNYKAALNYLEESNKIRNVCREISNTENIRQVNSMFNYQRIAKEKARFEKKAHVSMIVIYQVIIFFVIVLTACFIFFKNYQLRKRQLLYFREQKYKRSEQYIEDNKIQIKKLEEKFSSDVELISDVQKQLYATRKLAFEMENRRVISNHDALAIFEKDFKTSAIYLKAHGEEWSFTESEWEELCLLLDATYSGFTQRLIKLYPRISQEELRICYLIKMGVAIKKIGLIMCISTSAVSQSRRRLYKKLTNEPESAEKLDALIIDF